MRELNLSGFKKLPGLRQLVSDRTKIPSQVSSDPRMLVTLLRCLLRWGGLGSSTASVAEWRDDLEQATCALWTVGSLCGPHAAGDACAMDAPGSVG